MGPELQLTRFAGVAHGGSVGRWLVRGRGLELQSTGDRWQVRFSPFWDAQHELAEPPPRADLELWLALHGLDRALFPTRVAALRALSDAHRVSPLPLQRRGRRDV